MIEEQESLSNAPNSPTLNGKQLGKISSDFAIVCEQLKEAAYQIQKRGFSDYPIFVTSTQPLPLGSTFLGKGEFNGNNWYYNASTFEEFYERKLIAEDAEESFKANYKDKNEFCCLFVMNDDFASFVFIPYPDDLAGDESLIN